MTPAINEIHHATETTMNTLSIIFNCYLLYLIKYRSTFGIKLYQYLLTVDVILDLCFCIGAFLAQPVFLTANGYTVYISNGFFAGHSPFLDSFFGTFYLFALHTNVVWIPVQFVYRYRLLCKHNSNSKLANLLIIIVAVTYSMIAMLVIRMGFCEMRDEFQPIGREVLDLNSWPNAKHYFFMGRSINEWPMVAYLILWSITCWSSIGIVIWCEKSIAKNYNQLSNLSQGSGNANTQKMHREFHRALLAMAICPIVTTTVPVIYFVITIALQLRPGLISAIMTIFLSSITLFNPLTTIVCFRCYRQFTVCLITCGRYCNPKKVKTGTAAGSTALSADATLSSSRQLNKC